MRASNGEQANSGTWASAVTGGQGSVSGSVGTSGGAGSFNLSSSGTSGSSSSNSYYQQTSSDMNAQAQMQQHVGGKSLQYRHSSGGAGTGVTGHEYSNQNIISNSHTLGPTSSIGGSEVFFSATDSMNNSDTVGSLGRALSSSRSSWNQDSRTAFQKFDPTIGIGSNSQSSSSTLFQNLGPPLSRSSNSNHRHTNSHPHGSLQLNGDNTSKAIQNNSLTWDGQTFPRSRLGVGSLFSNAAHGPLEDVDETVARTPTEQRQRVKLQDLFNQPPTNDADASNTSRPFGGDSSSGILGDQLGLKSHPFPNLTSNSDTVSSVQSLPVGSSVDLQSLFGPPPTQSQTDDKAFTRSPPGLSVSVSERTANARRGSTGMHRFSRGFDTKGPSVIGANRRGRLGSHESDQSFDSLFGGFNSDINIERNNLTLPLPDRSQQLDAQSSAVLLPDIFGPQIRRPNSTGQLLPDDDPVQNGNEGRSNFKSVSFLKQQRDRGFTPIVQDGEKSDLFRSQEGGSDSLLVRRNSHSSLLQTSQRKTLDLVREDSNSYSNGTTNHSAASLAPPTSVEIVSNQSASTAEANHNQEQNMHTTQSTTTDQQQQTFLEGARPEANLNVGMAALNLGPSAVTSQQPPPQPQAAASYAHHVPYTDPRYSPHTGVAYSPHQSPYHSPHVTGLAGPPMTHHTPGHTSPQYYNPVVHSVYGHALDSPHVSPHAAPPPYLSPDPYGRQIPGQGASSPFLAPPTYLAAPSSPLPHQGMYTQPVAAPQVTYAHIAPAQQQQPYQQQYTTYQQGVVSQPGQYGNQTLVHYPSTSPAFVVQSHGIPQGPPQQYVVVQQTPGGQVVLAPAASIQNGNFGSPQGVQEAPRHRDDYRNMGRGGRSGGGRYTEDNGMINRDSNLPYSSSHMNHGHGRGHTKGYSAGHGGSGPGSGQGSTSFGLVEGETLSLLDEFKRSQRGREWTVQNNVKGHVVEFCKDQNGSRFLQARLDIDATGIEGTIIIDEILEDLDSVKNDVFGNYVLQKLLEKGSLEIRDRLWYAIKGQGLSLSMLMYGCRVIQKAIETLPAERILELVQEFHGHVVPLIEDQNGNHVCQKLIEVLSSKAKSTTADGRNHYSDALVFIIDDVLSHIARLSCHPYGCRVLQRILEHSIQLQKEQVLDAIADARSTLLDDQYGNYVIQHVLQFGRVPDREGILQLVLRRQNGVLILSRQKFASNVVEKLLKYGTVNQRLRMLNEMLKEVIDDEAEGPTAIVLLMVRDPYANYVVQTTLDVVPEGQERNRLIEVLTINAEKLRNYTYAKHIVAKVCQ